MGVSLAASSESRAGPSRSPARGPASLGDGRAASYLSGIKGQVDKITVLRVATWNLAVAAQERASEAPRSRPRTRVAPASGGQATGDCAAMKPAGFPDYIIQRESGGNPNAVNRSSNALGCVQILGSHYRPGGTCYGLSQGDCWAKMYREQGLRPWACTPESGCG